MAAAAGHSGDDVRQPEQVSTIALTVNGQRHRAHMALDTPLLWVLRDTLGLTGTKFGCGIGACTVHLDGKAFRSCTLPVSAVTRRGSTFTSSRAASRPGGSVSRAYR
jgi:isoquinoline 1-oxidoreductase alpha subunit